jgi:hypothetical protein
MAEKSRLRLPTGDRLRLLPIGSPDADAGRHCERRSDCPDNTIETRKTMSMHRPRFTAGVTNDLSSSIRHANRTDTGSVSGRLFSHTIGSIDLALRRIYGIAEFELEDDGLLRIAICRAERELILSDGTRIRRGDSVVDLHIWNEHLPCFPANSRDFGWAARVRRKVLSSLNRLALHMRTNPNLDRVQALRMAPAIAHRRPEKPLALLPGSGFESAAPSRQSRLPDSLDSVWVWLLTWAYNPRALAGRCFARTRQEFWISRSRFLILYGERLGARQAGASSPP